ncbi:hypothetical protein ACFXGA_02435 [Actinosynnema sp. NPDC059335]|uniref:hypothetical protein n=1 Tax=Actinosynnema sp. NPDC059335 TaxID=3346804 RepID=UPI003671B01B
MLSARDVTLSFGPRTVLAGPPSTSARRRNAKSDESDKNITFAGKQGTGNLSAARDPRPQLASAVGVDHTLDVRTLAR